MLKHERPVGVGTPWLVLRGRCSFKGAPVVDESAIQALRDGKSSRRVTHFSVKRLQGRRGSRGTVWLARPGRTRLVALEVCKGRFNGDERLHRLRHTLWGDGHRVRLRNAHAGVGRAQADLDNRIARRQRATSTETGQIEGHSVTLDITARGTDDWAA